MKKLSYFLLVVLALACKTEGDVQPASGNFTRYFGSEYNHNAVLALEAGSGLSLLGNIDIQDANDPTKVGYKIKFIRTDLDGNILWEKVYPEFTSDKAADTINYKGASFIPLANSGYLIVGERIKANDISDLLLLLVDENGTVQTTTTIPNPNTSTGSLHGRAVIADSDDNYIVLGRIEDGTSNDMYVAKYSSQDLQPMWEKKYGAGLSSLINRVYSNTGNFVWGGSVRTSTKFDVRLIKAPENSQGVINGNPVGEPDLDEEASDFCSAIGGWAVTGTTDKNGDSDILIMKVSNTITSQVIFSQAIRNEGTEVGNGICQLSDGSLAVLGTAESSANQKDLYLAKIDGLGASVDDQSNAVPLWEHRFGGADDEVGASVRQLSDESILIFGTTSFGRVKKLMLMKVSADGNL